MFTIPITRRHKIFFWLTSFLFLQMFFVHGQNGNTMSRFTHLYAMCENEFFIDQSAFRTPDWARTPDGHYYSNKPPGPVFLAFPLFRAADLWLTRGAATRAERDRIRFSHTRQTQYVLSLLLQVVPLMLVTFFCLLRLEKLGVSNAALDLACLSALFGNTAIIYANIFFGHAMSGWLFMALFLAVDAKAHRWAGFLLGWLVMAEYTLAVLIPVCAWAMRKEVRASFWKVTTDILIGAALPAALFMGYHAVCFGGPLTPAVAYQNPEFVDVRGPSFLGIFRLLPSPTITFKLLFGFREGILWTQPWLFLAAFAGFRMYRTASSSERNLIDLGLGGLIVLTLVISAFGGWHGGRTAGPRYLSGVFPLCGIVLGAFYDRLPRAGRWAAVITTWVGVLFCLVAIATDIIPIPKTMVWLHYRDLLVVGMWTKTHMYIALWTGLLAAGWVLRAKEPEKI